MDELTSYEADAVKRIAFHRRKLEGAIQDALDNGLRVSGHIVRGTTERVSIVIDMSKPIELPE